MTPAVAPRPAWHAWATEAERACLPDFPVDRFVTAGEARELLPPFTPVLILDARGLPLNHVVGANFTTGEVVRLATNREAWAPLVALLGVRGFGCWEGERMLHAGGGLVHVHEFRAAPLRILLGDQVPAPWRRASGA